MEGPTTRSEKGRSLMGGPSGKPSLDPEFHIKRVPRLRHRGEKSRLSDKMWQNCSEKITMLSNELRLRSDSARPWNSNRRADPELRHSQGNSGDTYGDTSYRTFLLFPATLCKLYVFFNILIINELRMTPQRYAAPCKSC
jgi:hypothetical protein